MSDLSTAISGKVYSNAGNPDLVNLLDVGCRKILDVGCGAGDNAALLRRRLPGCEIFGVTGSALEAAQAAPHMSACWMFDIETGIPKEAAGRSFDALIFSHVLEHLRDPAAVLAVYSRLLRPKGSVLIAVPNVLVWRQRLKFLLGHFEYEESGILDQTHLRFFTYRTACRYLLSRSPDLALESLSVTGNVPLWILRRARPLSNLVQSIDRLGARALPNLFGSQVMIKAVKRG